MKYKAMALTIAALAMTGCEEVPDYKQARIIPEKTGTIRCMHNVKYARIGRGAVPLFDSSGKPERCK